MKTFIADKFPIEIPSQINSYEFIRVLDHTSYSIIALVRLHSIDYACKVVARAILVEHHLFEFFEREIRILESISHPNIVRLIEVVYQPDLIFVIMEYCCGGDVLRVIQTLGRFSESECRSIIREVLHGLNYLHERNISHRDIKPENILLDRDGRAKIADFGLSRQIVKDALLDTHCGSLEYCPPEMLLGGQYDGKAADIWSLGILFYGMAAGRLPWISHSEAQLRLQVVRGDIELPACACSAIRRLLKRMLCVEPGARATVAELLGDPWFREGGDEGGWERQTERHRRLSDSASLSAAGGAMRLGGTVDAVMMVPWKTRIIVKPQVALTGGMSPPAGQIGSSRIRAGLPRRLTWIKQQSSMGALG